MIQILLLIIITILCWPIGVALIGLFGAWFAVIAIGFALVIPIAITIGLIQRYIDQKKLNPDISFGMLLSKLVDIQPV